MGPTISLLIIVAVSLLVVRMGTIALTMTGLERDVANFQAHSAFFGVGFTTSEAELVVSNPTRRRIIKHLILTGNVGLTAGLGSIIVAFVKAGNSWGALNVLLWIAGGTAALWLLSITPAVRRVIDWAIRGSLRASGVVRPTDFALLLRVHAGCVVEEVTVQADNPLVGRSLAESRLGSRGVVVLGCSRGGGESQEYIGTPSGSFRMEAGDRLTVYGRQSTIAEVLRPQGVGRG